ncbi:hypothetical protein AJ79_06693 [Helicocarpus griseus UAMH5409]|uniref:Uncharacterized protein n=1 Tax=Helicocarpus griseus UAMH5409 TaxID=1447875 RepID=A0A2B7XAQ7_9EURO|nr:hypothetical protein AJ79_06693 [Helicocarpus griseus UAMH5409]
MKFSLFATLALFGLALAADLPNGAECTKDGKMGNCASGYCDQREPNPSGHCGVPPPQ